VNCEYLILLSSRAYCLHEQQYTCHGGKKSLLRSMMQPISMMRTTTYTYNN
jgi:hypothetical protein